MISAGRRLGETADSLHEPRRGETYLAPGVSPRNKAIDQWMSLGGATHFEPGAVSLRKREFIQ
jgi:hypothetical protein